MKIFLIVVVAAILPIIANARPNPNEAAMKSLILSKKDLVESLIQADQIGGPVELDESSIVCLGLEYRASPIGVCLLNAAREDRSEFFLYSVTISFPPANSQDMDLMLSVKLIEQAPF